MSKILPLNLKKISSDMKVKQNGQQLFGTSRSKTQKILEEATVEKVGKHSELVSFSSILLLFWWFLEANHMGDFFQILMIGRRNFNVEETDPQ